MHWQLFSQIMFHKYNYHKKVLDNMPFVQIRSSKAFKKPTHDKCHMLPWTQKMSLIKKVELLYLKSVVSSINFYEVNVTFWTFGDSQPVKRLISIRLALNHVISLASKSFCKIDCLQLILDKGNTNCIIILLFPIMFGQ